VDSGLPCSAIPAKGTAQLASAPCFQSNTLTVKEFTSTSATLVFNTQNPVSLLCSDWYLFGTMENVQIQFFTTVGDHEFTWNFSSTIKESELNDIKRNGFRAFAFQSDLDTTLYQLWETVMMFLPGLTQSQIPLDSQAQNAAFLANTVQINLEQRLIENVDLDESLIQSGDMFGLLRLDGLDPMLAWAMGSHTGHTTVAIRVDGQLLVCESTTNSSYWPTNGIQCTPYQQWVVQVRNASENVVHLPLRPDVAARFNTDAAYAFFKQNEGHDYGYHNLLWGWQDNIGNYMPALTPELHQLLPAIIGKLVPSVADLLWNQAFNLRVGITADQPQLDAADVMEYAWVNKGWDFRQLHWVEERDDLGYKLNVNSGGTTIGKSMVCNVFVCSMWKAGGLFADQPDFQCTETTNWDVETLNIFNANFQRPLGCMLADPDSPFCQISGLYRVEIPFYNSRWPIPPNAFANCPRGESPLYNKPYPC